MDLILKQRPILIALIIISICLLLLRPRKKPSAQQGTGQEANACPSSAQPRKRSLSISTVGVLLDFHGGAPQMIAAAAEALASLAEQADIYLITQLEQDTDAQEAAVLAVFEAAGIFGPGRCDRRKVLFCATEDGKGAMCRQLAPNAHVDTSSKVLGYLAPHVPQVVMVGQGPIQQAPKCICVPSLVDYLSQRAS